MKKLKTGDVRRFKSKWWMADNYTWAVVGRASGGIQDILYAAPARSWVRRNKGYDRIARILSIGPKYVTVRISK